MSRHLANINANLSNIEQTADDNEDEIESPFSDKDVFETPVASPADLASPPESTDENALAIIESPNTIKCSNCWIDQTLSDANITEELQEHIILYICRSCIVNDQSDKLMTRWKRPEVSTTKLNDHYEVEYVIKMRERNCKTQYQLKWLNYNMSESTWTDESECYYCLDPVNQLRTRLNLPSIFIKPPIGSTLVSKPNYNKWTTIDQAIKASIKMMKYLKINSNIESLTDNDTPKANTIYLFEFELHAYIILQKDKLVYVGDGANL